MGITKQITDFASDVRFGNLPEDIIHETKRTILDSIGCTISGHRADKGSIAVNFAKRLGGSPESTIIGTRDKVSCANAAFANAELMNSLDSDPMCLGGFHNSPMVVGAPLAVVETMQPSGKDLILAIALGHELTARIGSATAGSMGGVMYPVADGLDRCHIEWSQVSGYAHGTISAAAGVGKLVHLNQEQMANALGIAGYIALPNTLRKQYEIAPVRMAKYGILGWGAQGGVASALLAEMGYTGDTEVLDGDYGFWRFTGHTKWDVKPVLENLGKEWQQKILHKPYLCAG